MVRLLLISAGSPSIGDEGDKQLHNHIFRLIGQRLEHAERRIADFALNSLAIGTTAGRFFSATAFPRVDR
jgi:hypothetical protein